MFDSFIVRKDWGLCCSSYGALSSVSIPDFVLELCDECFSGCKGLYSVKSSCCSSLERIGVSCFVGSGLRDISIPDSVRELCDRCFQGCRGLRVTLGPFSCLERIGINWINGTLIRAVRIPDSVSELCDGCFNGYRNPHVVTFGLLSSLVRIGVSCFEDSQLCDIHIPDSVHELCNRCFYNCTNLKRVTFGFSSSLERIGVEAFSGDRDEKKTYEEYKAPDVVEINIPASVHELGEMCFFGCGNLERVTFGSPSSLRRIGARCFGKTRLQGQLDFMTTDRPIRYWK